MSLNNCRWTMRNLSIFSNLLVFLNLNILLTPLTAQSLIIVFDANIFGEFVRLFGDLPAY